MQKKIIALAVAGLVSGGAFAQANVTMSGQFRVGIESVSAGGCSAVGCANLTSRTRVADENSNIRFAGEESLGGNLKAWFQVESALGTSDNIGTTGAAAAGANSATLGTRNTAVGLKGAFGNFFVGKWDMHYSSHAGVDGNGLAPHSGALDANSLSIIHNIGGFSGAGGRANNAIMYSSPNFSGFDINLGYSTTFTGNESTAAGADKEGNVWINPRYNNGPITAFYSYLKRSNIGNTAPVLTVDQTADAKYQRAGAAYTFPMGFKVGLIWDRNECTSSGAGTGCITGQGVNTTAKRTAWVLPLSYTTGAHTIIYTYARANKVSVNGADAADTGANMNVLGYTYAMSKRTSVNASWWGINNQNNATYDGWHPSSSVAAGTAVLPAGADPRAFTLQMNHTF